MREVALLLTVDANGNDATSPDFDPDNIVQFGYYEQWTDFRGAATLFGPGSLVDENGNAQVPDQWRDAAEWFYDGMWNEVFTPMEFTMPVTSLPVTVLSRHNVAMAHPPLVLWLLRW